MLLSTHRRRRSYNPDHGDASRKRAGREHRPVTFKDHFSGHAGDYATARPTYPAALFDWLVARCPDRELAWDAGCGNGQASLALARRFRRVHASDPSAEQIANARSDRRVSYRVEPAEACSLPDASAALITVAQAYHWIDHARFAAEARRVLVPAGLLAVFNYARSQVDGGTVDRIFGDLHDRTLAADWPPERQHAIAEFRALPFPFTELGAVPDFELRCDWTLAQYLAYLRSWSASRRHLARTGRDPVAAIAPAMAAAWGDPDTPRPVRWPLMLRVGRRPA